MRHVSPCPAYAKWFGRRALCTLVVKSTETNLYAVICLSAYLLPLPLSVGFKGRLKDLEWHLIAYFGWMSQGGFYCLFITELISTFEFSPGLFWKRAKHFADLSPPFLSPLPVPESEGWGWRWASVLLEGKGTRLRDGWC